MINETLSPVCCSSVFSHQGMQGNVGMRGPPGFIGERVRSSSSRLSGMLKPCKGELC